MSSQENSSASLLQNDTKFLRITDSVTGEERKLAYVKEYGTRTPGLIFIAGFMSTKDAIKPVAFQDFCKKHDFPYIRYDATALGETESSVEMKDARFSHWLQDAEEVLLQLTEGPQLVIGSSMGGWIASCLAKKYPEKFHSLLLLAPSINYSNYYIERIRKRAPPDILEQFESDDGYQYNDPKYGTYPLSRRLFEEMIPYELPLEEAGGYPVSCPVRIIHGTNDTYSPYPTSLKLLTGFATSDINLLYVKGADHHFDDPASLEMVFDIVMKMISSSAKL